MSRERRSGPPQARPGFTTPRPRVPAATDMQIDLLDLLEPPSIAERFRRFAEGNPHVYRILVTRTREFLARTGLSRVGIALIWEVMRWDVAVQTGEAPKLNNNFKAYYARQIMEQEADLAEVFDTRSSAADKGLRSVDTPALGTTEPRGPAAALASPPGGQALSASRTSQSGQSRDASRDVTRDMTRD